jgi:ectoine hydroxylase-related dioxygenase (phytanoyl-CoA dioxygenase family)
VSVPVRAGDVVVFSSLSPHATGVNTTGSVREAYIVQYAHDGAVGRLPGPDGQPGDPISLDEPARQFPVLVDGRRVAPPPR